MPQRQISSHPDLSVLVIRRNLPFVMRRVAHRGRGMITLALAFLVLPVSAAEIRSTDDARIEARRGTDGWRLDGPSLSTAIDLPTTALVHDLRWVADRWFVAAIDGEGVDARIVLATGSASDGDRLPGPAPMPGFLRRAPTLLVEPTRGVPEALAWLEGHDPRQLEVRSARWLGAGWSEPITVATPAVGTQTALDAARLDDGSWLLVWSAFDGLDDDILWSRFADGAWSAPAALTADDRFDVTPSVRAVEGGAVAVWSGDDGGDYRLEAARFDAATGRWGDAVTFGGRGAFDPELSTLIPAAAKAASSDGAASGGPLLLTYRQEVPRAWVVAELSTDGTVARSASAEAAMRRPRVLAVDTDGVRIAAPRTADSTVKRLDREPVLLRWEAPAD
ncbi:MAG: hypothetical protein AAGN46_07980 [Acidobacteriota bacterium]